MIQQSLFDNSERQLFEQITSIEQLAEAYRLVKANQGAPGVDGISVMEFGTRLEEELSSLSQEVRSWKYSPKPVKQVRIPKPESTEERLLGIPCVRDRVLQQSIRMSLEELFEPEFSPNSFGFRRGRLVPIEVSRMRSLKPRSL
jgi:RNA-directed DNA polymerase